jgi:hypothetical protein
VAAAACAALALTAGCGRRSPESVYTSIRPEDCAPPPDDVAATYASRDLGVQQCPSLEGWRLLLVASDANTWLEVRGPSVTWSAEQAVVYDSRIGLFPSVGGSETVEWRRVAGGDPVALIFRVTAQDPENPETHRVAFFVARLERDRACVLGRAATGEEARSLADTAQGCEATTPPA